MGPLMVAMPRKKYQGAFSDNDSSSVSKLIGCDTVHTEMIVTHMSDRLSKKFNLAVFCSCCLDDTPTIPGCDGVIEQQLLQSQAAALAEREIGRILEQKLQR